MDANLYNTPLAEYPRIPWILWTSLDYPWMPTYIVSTNSLDTLDIPGLSVDANLYNTPLAVYPRIPWTLNIPGLSVDANLYNTRLAEYPQIPGYSGHPWIIRGCQPI